MAGAAMTMQVDQLHSWVARARPGDDVVYDIGVRPGDAIGAAVRALHHSGLVTMTAKRVDGGFRHIAQRLPDRAARRAPARGRVRLAANDAKMTMRAVLRILQQAASRDLPCPTNAELARRIGLKDAVAASYRVRRLVAAGKIVVEEPSPLERRVVTIVATGKSTVRGVL